MKRFDVCEDVSNPQSYLGTGVERILSASPRLMVFDDISFVGFDQFVNVKRFAKTCFPGSDRKKKHINNMTTATVTTSNKSNDIQVITNDALTQIPNLIRQQQQLIRSQVQNEYRVLIDEKSERVAYECRVESVMKMIETVSCHSFIHATHEIDALPFDI